LCCVPPIDDAKKYEVQYAHHPHTLLLVKEIHEVAEKSPQQQLKVTRQ
jgi:hypothetical protein